MRRRSLEREIRGSLSGKRPFLERVSLKISVIYAVFSALWILLSDQIVHMFVRDREFMTNIQMFKGWLFVLASAILIFILLRREIDRYRRTEEALKKSEQRLQAILDASPDPVVVYDRKGYPEFLNPAFTELFGWRIEEVKGKRIPFVPDDQKELTAKSIEKLYQSGRKVQIQTKRLTKKGDVVDILISAALIKGSEGTPAGMVVNLTDISRVMKLEHQLQQARKMESIGRLAGGVAHDFNNMLNIILGHTEMIIEELGNGNPLMSGMREIRTAAERSGDLIRQLLAFARKQTISPRVLDLNEILEKSLKMLRRLIGEGIHLSWRPRTNLWPVKLDPFQVDQVLTNLCINARDAVKGVGNVTIKTDNASFDAADCRYHDGVHPGDYVMIAVSDNGSGMEPETLKGIFEPFFTTKAVGEGTGLGLATVYGIVKQNDGFIDVYSDPGVGTTFKIYLPRHAKEKAQKPVSATEASTPVGAETILLVEDEKGLLHMMKMMLERLGYAVLDALGPTEAIGICESHNGEIHLLITDVVMPKMSGRDLAERLLPSYPNIKCLFMSGYSADIIARQGVLDQCVQFIHKPFNREDLARKVREILDADGIPPVDHD